MKQSLFLGHGVLLILSLIFCLENAAAQGGGYTLADTTRARLLQKNVSQLLDREQLEQASMKADTLIDMYEDIYGTESRQVAKAMNMKAIAVFYMGNMSAAKDFWEKALQIRIKVLGPAHEDVSASYNNLGGLYFMTGQVQKAAEYYEQAVQILDNMPSRNNKSLIDPYYNLGMVYSKGGNQEKSTYYYQKSLNYSVIEYSEKHPLVAACYKGLGDAAADKGDYAKSREYHEKAIKIFEGVFGAKSPAAADTYNSLARTYHQLGDYDTAIKFFEICLATHAQNTLEDRQSIANIHGNMANSYEKKGDLKEATRLYLEALKLQQNLSKDWPQNYDSYATYNNLAIIFDKQGDTDRAFQYFENAFAFYREQFGPEHPKTVKIMSNLGLMYIDDNRLEQALEYLNKSIEINNKLLGENHPENANQYNGLGTYYDKIGNYAEALRNIRKGASIVRQNFGGEHPDLATYYNNLGIILGKIDSLESGAAHLQTAINITQKHTPGETAALASYHRRLGDNLVVQGRWGEAQNSYSAAAKSLNFNGESSVKNTLHSQELIYLLNSQVKFQQKKHTVDSALFHLRSASNTSKLALSATNHLSRSLSPASKSHLASTAAEICASAIATNQLLHQHTDSLHYWQESFAYAERSKAYLLYEAMKDADALHIAGIPDSLLEQEYNLRIEIAYQDKRKQEKISAGQNETDTVVLSISSRLFDLKRRHEALIARFEADYPQYYQAKYGLATVSVDDVQKRLLPKQTMLQYVVGDSAIFLFVVQPQHFDVRELPRDFALEAYVDTLTRLGIYAYHTLPLAQKTSARETAANLHYTRAARLLYDKLLAPVQDRLTSELIIIPDGVLSYVPFEALLPKAPGRVGFFPSYPFLLKERRISYCYSATLLREMQDKQHRQRPKKTALAFAPFFRGDLKALRARLDSTDVLGSISLRDSLNALPASGDEAGLAAKIWKGKPLYGAAAMLDSFYQLAEQYRILHLSTHGKADDRVGDYAYLAFSSPSGDVQQFDKLYARDLYNLALNADLVVLSACEAGVGKLRLGEGIISLARAFAYAGAKSLVTSLWKVDDAKTKDLLFDFHRYLKAGKTKDEALQRAKLDFLKKYNEVEQGAYSHPYFWAGFIGIGDMRPIKP